MALPTDDPSIAQALRLKHYKDFCEAIGANDENLKKQRVKDFRTKFNSLSLPDGDEKGWVQTIAATVVQTKSSIADSFTAAVALRKKLNGCSLDLLRNAIEKLGTRADEWLDAFKVGANMIGSLSTIATVVGVDNLAWTLNVPSGSRSVTPISQCLEKLKQGSFKTSEIRALWTRFQGLDFNVIWALAEQIPEPLHCAFLHVTPVAPDIFWLTGLTDATKAKAVAEKVYSDGAYAIKPKAVNAVAVRLINNMDKAWVKLFTCTQLSDIHDQLHVACPLLIDLFFGTAGTIATTNSQKAETAEFKAWISLNCDIVAKLAHNGYPITAIMKMFDEKLNRRLMVSCTWFRRQPPPASMLFFFKVYEDPSNPSKGVKHGGLAANGDHLALRHLYENFAFNNIETHNSFHPRTVSPQDLVVLANGITLNHMNQDSIQYVGGYAICVTAHDSASARRVKSFYPTIPTTDPNYYTRAQLQSIRDVLALVPLNLLAI